MFVVGLMSLVLNVYWFEFSLIWLEVSLILFLLCVLMCRRCVCGMWLRLSLME